MRMLLVPTRRTALAYSGLLILPVLVAVSIRLKFMTETIQQPVEQHSEKYPNSAIALARSLEPPSVTSTMSGELEGIEFWQEHEVLLQKAWKEWSEAEEQQALPALDEDVLINPALRDAVQKIWENPAKELEDKMLLQSSILQEIVPRVYQCQLFTQEGVRRIRQHLDAIQHSSVGIPTRRPHGMNRFGIVLDPETQGGVWYAALANFRLFLSATYLRPIGRMLFPKYIGPNDDAAVYAFTIRYQPKETNGDFQLNEHSDASVITLNVNLNLPNEEDYSMMDHLSTLLVGKIMRSVPKWSFRVGRR